MKTVLTFFELCMAKVNRYRSSNNWLLDIIAPNQQLTTAVIANFGQVMKQGEGKVGNGDIKIHLLTTQLVDREVLQKMGASKVEGVT